MFSCLYLFDLDRGVFLPYEAGTFELETATATLPS